MDKYPKIIPITHSYLGDCRIYPISHGLLHIRVIKPIITDGVLCIVENNYLLKFFHMTLVISSRLSQKFC